MSTGAYSPSKILAWPDRLETLRSGGQPYPVHLQIILSDLCNLDCPQCFVPGTLVATPDGERSIDKIRIGDVVIGHDGERHLVTDISRREYSGPLVLIRLTDGIRLRCTPEHPIYVADPATAPVFGWRVAKNIRVGDLVQERIAPGEWESRTVVEVITGTNAAMYHGWVHNLEVGGAHSYIANGIVVHNCAYRLSGYTSNQLFSVQNADGSFNHNPNRMLDPDLVKSIIDDCVTMGVRACQWTGGGESTIHPNARELFEYAQQKGLDTALVTNGLNLERRIGDVALRMKWLRISVDAATPEMFAKVRPAYKGSPERSRANFAQVIETIRWAVKRKRELGSDCVIGMGFVTQEENWRELADFVRLARDLGVDNVRISGAFTPKGDAYHANYRAEALELERQARELATPSFAVHARFAEKLDDLAARPDYKDCWYQQVTTYIGGDANLYRCCVQAYNRHGLIGNVREAGGFKALWDSETKRQKFRNFDARSCATCQFSDRNRAIDAAIKEPAREAPSDIVHKSFV